MNIFSLMDLSSNILLLIACSIGFIFSKSILVPTFAYLIMSISLILIYLPKMFKLFPEFDDYKFKWDKPVAKKLISFGIPVILGSACIYILEYIDTIMLTYFSDLGSVGLYNVASPVAGLLGYFGIAVATIIMPLTSELWAGNKKEILKRGINMIYRYAFIIMWPISFIFLTFPELIINLFFGPRYFSAVSPLRILSVGIIFLAMSNLNGQILSGIGKPKFFTRIIILGAFINIILNWLLIPKYNMDGAAIATSSSYFLMFIFTSYTLKKFTKHKIPVLKWIENILLSAFLVLVIYFLKNILAMNVILEAVIVITVSMAIYVSLALIIKLTTIDEIKEIIKRVS